MDYSHLHTYAPPQCLPDNTGYTYALSSSYSTEALDFETVNKIAPVFDSPRMSRRSLRLLNTTGNYSDDVHNESIGSNVSFSGSVSKDRSFNRSGWQQHNSSRQSTASSHHSATRNALSNSSFVSQSSFTTHVSDTSMRSSVLDESLIREQTEVDHLWGLDDEDLLKGGDTTVIQANGDLNSAETQTTMINGYTCSDCSMLSDRNDALTAYSKSRAASATQREVQANTTATKVYTRERNQKHKSREMAFYTHKAMLLVINSASTLASLVVKLFHMVMLKLNCELKAHSNYCGSMNVRDYLKEDGHLRVTGESLCDDCKGKQHHETHTTVLMQSSRAKRVTGTLWYIFSNTGTLLLHAVRNVGAAGWFVSRKVLSFLWLAIVSPGKAASGLFWWLGTGWYQLATLAALLNVFFLTRCLPAISKLLLLLIPLLLLLGLWFWGLEDLFALLPTFSGLRIYSTHTAEDTVQAKVKPAPDIPIHSHGKKDEILLFDDDRFRELENKFLLMAVNQSHHMEEYKQLLLMVHKIQQQIGQMSDQSQISAIITNILEERITRQKVDQREHSEDASSVDKDHEARILHLEAMFAKLTQAIEEDRKLSQSKKSGGEVIDQGLLRSRLENLEQEFAQYKAQLLKEQTARANCEQADCVLQKVDAKVRESIQMMFASQESLPPSLLQWLSTNYMTKGDFHSTLQELELKILQNITHYVSITKQKPTAKVVERVVTGGISGITEEEAQAIVNNALRLYSQDRTGMVDFALESGGGSILGTRCSETYETKTALMSLFGIPLWYFSQSPRVVIQPDMYPGNCWAFKGAQGYLVVRLSMMIYPTAFSLEHIPKSLSPTGNITSAPKDFAVYGLDDEYQEDGRLLVRSVYEESGEPLQIFHLTEENTTPFQIVELRIFSNWGHTDYTCLYRFRAHGTPVK
ncbi:SUN domain-containing protein 1 [Rhinophrynus dorsalis]